MKGMGGKGKETNNDTYYLSLISTLILSITHPTNL
jgi:hypothetical protein